MTTVTYSSPLFPDITLTRGDDGGFSAVVGLEDLDPQRGVTLEEQGLGISSLKPPTVVVRPRQKARDTHRALMRTVLRAVTTAVYETDFGASERQRGMAGQVWIVLRTSLALRRALRLLGEDI